MPITTFLLGNKELNEIHLLKKRAELTGISKCEGRQ
jgi:hypothetical protein